MSWVAAGVGSAALTFSAVSAITGSRAKKKRANELKQKIAEITAKVAESTKTRLREVDKLTDEQIKYAGDSLNQISEYYADLKLKYNALAERNKQAAEEQFGEQLRQIETNLQEELGISDDAFSEYVSGVDSLYADTRDLYQADLAFNDNLKEEFRTNADKAIKDTWNASADAKIDLQQLKDSGGRPESFDRVVAENAKAFGDIQTDIDRNDAARGRTDLTGKKLTTQFAEAMSKGNIAGQMAGIGTQQEQALRSEVVGLGNTGMNQSMAKLQGGQQTSGRELADVDMQFQNQKVDALFQQGMNELNLVQDKNQKEVMAQSLYTDTVNQIEAMLQNGELTADQAVQAERQLSAQLVMQAKEQNWNYKDVNARAHENQMLATVGQAGKELSGIDPRIDWGQVGMAGVQGFTSVYSGGGFGGGSATAQKPPQQYPANNDYGANGGGGMGNNDPYMSNTSGHQKPSLFGTKGTTQTPSNNNGRYLGRFGQGR